MNNVPPDPAPLFAPFLARAEAAESEAASLRAALTAEREAHATTKRARDQAAGEADAFVKSHDDFANACRAAMECAGRVLPLHASEVPAWIVRLGSQRDDAQRRANEAEGERDVAIARAETAERERDEARAEIERLEAIEMPADVEQAFERGWSARAAATRRAERERDEVRAACAAMRRVLLDVWDASSRGDEEGCQQGNNLDLTLAICATKTVTDATDAGAPLLAELRALRAVRDAARVVADDWGNGGTEHSQSVVMSRLRAALDGHDGRRERAAGDGEPADRGDHGV